MIYALFGILLTFAEPKIVGTWQLVQFERQNDQGQWEPRCFGPTGIITYTAAGYMAVGINCMKAEGSTEPTSDPDLVIFYTGKYELAKNSVTHHVQNSATRDFFGKDLVREFKFEGTDRIHLSGKGRSGKNVRLVWQRAN
jgi:hypothetical protein